MNKYIAKLVLWAAKQLGWVSLYGVNAANDCDYWLLVKSKNSKLRNIILLIDKWKPSCPVRVYEGTEKIQLKSKDNEKNKTRR